MHCISVHWKSKNPIARYISQYLPRTPLLEHKDSHTMLIKFTLIFINDLDIYTSFILMWSLYNNNYFKRMNCFI